MSPDQGGIRHQQQQQQQQLREACLQGAGLGSPTPQQQQHQQLLQVVLPAPGLEPEVTALLCDGANGVIITGGNDATIRVSDQADVPPVTNVLFT
jgi:hypothetical protein